MHTFDTDLVNFNYNSDFSGNIFITAADKEGKPQTIILTLDDLEAFMANKEKRRAIEAIERMTYDEIMTLAYKEIPA